MSDVSTSGTDALAGGDKQVHYCVECGAETELECICDDLNFADGERVVIDGEVYVKEYE